MITEKNIENHKWQPIEDWEVEDIWQQIGQIARSMRDYIKHEQANKQRGHKMTEKQWVECLKCDKQFEQPKNDVVCIYCNNQDREETIYIYPKMIKEENRKDTR